jgi:hypothetical protein
LLLQVRLFESVNFLDFAQFLAAFSDRASYEEKVKFIFWVYDVDGDGEQAVHVPFVSVRAHHTGGAGAGLLIDGGQEQVDDHPGLVVVPEMVSRQRMCALCVPLLGAHSTGKGRGAEGWYVDVSAGSWVRGKRILMRLHMQRAYPQQL